MSDRCSNCGRIPEMWDDPSDDRRDGERPDGIGALARRDRRGEPLSIEPMAGDAEPDAVVDPADVAAMETALGEARRAVEHDDVPVGAVVLRSGEMIAARHNERELTGDPTAHAEVLALRDAASAVGSWRLDDCTLVVTLEPCPMCAGALVNCRLGRLVYGASDPKAGACGSVVDLVDHPALNHRVPRTTGVLADECGRLLVDFFAARRGRPDRGA